MEEIKGAKILIESLKNEGVEVIFGYPGGAVLEIYDELFDTKEIKHYLTRHEQAAAHAADGYARSTGKVGVCLATSGPGATNLVTGLATAHMDSIPIVAITGQVPVPFVGKDAFQEADVTGITMPITKHNYLIKDVKDLARTVKEAFYIASSGRPGPVVIDIPKDITVNKCEFEYPRKIDLKSYKPTYFGNPKQIKAAKELISKSQRPVILAGGGIVSSGAAKELRTFVNNTNIPIAITLLAQGVIPDSNPLNLRMPGMHGTAYANYAIHEADLLIAIGMRFDDRITGKLSEFAKNAKVIHIDIDPAEIGKCVHVNIPIVGDAKNILLELNKNFKFKLKSNCPWLKKIKEYKKKHSLIYKQSKSEVKPQAVVEAIAEITKGEAIITTDVGENQMWACQYSNHKHPRHFLSSGGLGTMGYGFPAGIGAQVGNPDKLVVVISGDGSFQMNLQELSTAAYYNIPVKIAILNNQYLGMVRQWQELFYDKRYSATDLEGKQPDFVKLAEAYDVLGLRIKKPSEIKSSLRKAFKHKGPVVMDFRVRREENVFPMVPSGGVLNQMIFDPIID